MKSGTFRSRFSELFDESGKTTTELARDLHVSNQTISAWKTGNRSTKEPMIITIAKYFGVSVEWGSRGRKFESSHPDVKTIEV